MKIATRALSALALLLCLNIAHSQAPPTGNNQSGGGALPSGGSIGQCLVNTAPGAAGWNSCATGAVSTTGTPLAGELVQFSAAATITNGNLSGDCTTSNTFAITCLKTNGTNFGTFSTANAATPPAIGATTPAPGSFSAVTDTGVTGSTQCLHANSGGLISGTGSDCGSGGGLPSIANQTVLGNGSGSTAPAVALTLGGNLVATATGLSTSQPINAQVGTTYTMLSTDAGKLVTFNNAGAVAVTLSVATAAGFTAGYSFDIHNIGAGTVTVTPTTSTVDGSSTLTIAQDRDCTVTSDGTNYQVSACTAKVSGGGSGTVNSGTAGQLAFYSSTGTAVSGETTLTAAQMPALTGAVTSAAGSVATSLAPITNNSFFANASGSPAAPSATSPAVAIGILNSPACNAQTGTTYTLVLGDANGCVTMNNAAANTLTVPPNSSVALPVSTTITVEQIGAGITTISPGAGVTFTSLQFGSSTSISYALIGPFDFAQFKQTAANTWLLTIFGPGRQFPIIDAGTTFTLGTGTGACATTSTLKGGAGTGSFVCTGTAGASTQVINISGPAPKNGWLCFGFDTNTTTPTVLGHVGPISTTSCKIQGSVTATGDVITFHADGF